jgi:Flp pilus assembly protein TadD
MRRAKYTLAVLALALLLAHPAAAQCVQLAPDVCVTRKSYDAPVNEQPFYGFVAKTPAMIEADEKFVLEASKIGKEKAVAASLLRGEEALSRSDYPTAARRLNQAFLLEQGDSRLYHGFALIALYRFRDLAYAEELFVLARKLPNPAPSLRGDYGRLLMLAKRPGEARPFLESAVKETPNAPAVWTDLAFARLFTGDRAGACDASQQALRLSPPQVLADGINVMRSKAGCP